MRRLGHGAKRGIGSALLESGPQRQRVRGHARVLSWLSYEERWHGGDHDWDVAAAEVSCEDSSSSSSGGRVVAAIWLECALSPRPPAIGTRSAPPDGAWCSHTSILCAVNKINEKMPHSVQPYTRLPARKSRWARIFRPLFCSDGGGVKPVTTTTTTKEQRFFEKTGIIYSGGEGASVVLSVMR